MPGKPEFQRWLESIEELIRKIESAADSSLRTTAQELVQLVMELHGAGLERMLEIIRGTGGPGEVAIERLGQDELVSSLLVLYGLHPLDIEARVAGALDRARSRLRMHDAEVELVSIEDGAVRLQLHANGQGCGSTAQSLKQMVEEAVYQAAPDIAGLAIEGVPEKQSFVPLEMLRSSHPAPLALNGLSLTAGEKGGM